MSFKRIKARAKKAAKKEIGKIDDFALLQSLQSSVDHVNTRPVAHKVRLVVDSIRECSKMSQKPTNSIKNPRRFWKTEYEKVVSWLEEKYHNADPEARRKFEDKIDVSSKTTETEQEYFVDENSKEFGLTKGDYEFLLSDMKQVAEDANRKYGDGRAGTIDRYGNFYPLTGRPVRKKSKPITFATAVNKEGVKPNGK